MILWDVHRGTFDIFLLEATDDRSCDIERHKSALQVPNIVFLLRPQPFGVHLRRIDDISKEVRWCQPQSATGWWAKKRDRHAGVHRQTHAQCERPLSYEAQQLGNIIAVINRSLNPLSCYMEATSFDELGFRVVQGVGSNLIRLDSSPCNRSLGKSGRHESCQFRRKTGAACTSMDVLVSAAKHKFSLWSSRIGRVMASLQCVPFVPALIVDLAQSITLRTTALHAWACKF